MISLEAPFSQLSHLTGKEMHCLAAVGMHKVGDLLEYLPRRHEDRRRFDAFPNQPTTTAVCLKGKVIDSCLRRFGGRNFYEAVIMDDAGGVFGSGRITCRWFNMHFIHKLVATGHEIILYGKVKEAKNRLVIDQPEFEVLREDEDAADSVHIERVVPVYRNVTGISQRRLRELIYQLLEQLDPQSEAAAFRVIPEISRLEVLRMAHFPATLEQAHEAYRHFALEEFFGIQLNVVWRRLHHRQRPGRVLAKKTGLLKDFYRSLPFDLTGAQKRSIREIIQDMRSEYPMSRLLQGDVGAGKTFVAMASMLLAVDSGAQAALMAPTQILAEQHYLTFRRWLEPLGIRVVLRTGSRQESNHLEMEGNAQMIIGTHALLYDNALFADLGLVVIDEQHKFGVAQRAALVRQGIVPDVLVMTATPIPRTLSMTLYGDLDVSLLDEKPAGRGAIITGLRIKPKQTDVTSFVRDHLEKGRQAYLVYPLVEESDKLKAESAIQAHGKWIKRLPNHEIGLLHGKLRPEEKEAVMERFRSGKTDALVATTVIEVGVDVPNANVMVLHHAERFGLAQLHQLRGRIGRGDHKSYCILLTDGKSPEAVQKLKVLEDSADGFVIAEEDLKLRGPGDLLGTNQSGLGNIRFSEFLADTALLRQARELADKVIDQDPELSGPHAALRSFIVEVSDEDAPPQA